MAETGDPERVPARRPAGPTGSARPTGAAAIAKVLDLEELDRNLYRGTSLHPDRFRLYGGEVAAQALHAAALTVPEGRVAHSLHGYFLRPGQADRPVILRVDPDRDGRSFSARHVVALQQGEAIFTLSASFHEPEPSGEYVPAVLGDVPAPDQVGPDPFERYPGHPGHLDVFDIRHVERAPRSESPDWRPPHRLWARIQGPLPDDPLIHLGALTYLSDLGSGFGELDVDGLARGGPSLDHAMWFHLPVRADDWLLLELEPWRAADSRGTYRGAIRDRAGRLGAVLAQEALLRPRADMPFPGTPDPKVP